MPSKHSTLIVLVIAAVITIMTIICGCIQQPALGEESATLETEPIDLSGVQSEKLSFVKYYSLDSINVSLRVPQYELPLQTAKIYNYGDFDTKISLSEGAYQLLEKNGFVVISNPLNPKEGLFAVLYGCITNFLQVRYEL
ncbi:MAG: hypothetical protein WBB08_08450 [Halobacteriota archaeon]